MSDARCKSCVALGAAFPLCPDCLGAGDQAVTGPAPVSTGGCPNCGSGAIARAATGALAELLQEAGKAAAGIGTFVVGLLLLVFLPVVGAIVLALALLTNALVVITVVGGAIAAFRHRGSLVCRSCDYVWNPRVSEARGDDLADRSARPLVRPGFAWAAGAVLVPFALLIGWLALTSGAG